VTLLNAERTNVGRASSPVTERVSPGSCDAPFRQGECVSVRTTEMAVLTPCDSQTAREIGAGGQVPDGGTAVILLGPALSAFGVARRCLMS
jgi:protein with PEP-CTERM/exosortase system signal